MNTCEKVILIRLLLDGIGLVLVTSTLYMIVYSFKKYVLQRWIDKAVSAADVLFDGHEDDSVKTKKEWVVDFLKDNGLTSGISDGTVDSMIDASIGVNRRIA